MEVVSVIVSALEVLVGVMVEMVVIVLASAYVALIGGEFVRMSWLWYNRQPERLSSPSAYPSR